jgi:hypothetical protein
MKQSAWKKLVELINSFNTTPLMHPRVSRKYIMKTLQPCKGCTLDNYKLILMKLGYLKKVHAGVYEIMNRIPMSLTSEEAWKQCGYHKGKRNARSRKSKINR